MIHHEHWNTYMEWKFKSLRIWPSEKLIVREFRLRHLWKFFWDNNQKSFWDSNQMFTLNYPVHTKVNFEISFWEKFSALFTCSQANPCFLLLHVISVLVILRAVKIVWCCGLEKMIPNVGVKYFSITRSDANWNRFQCQKRCELWQHCKKMQQFSEIPIAYQNLCFTILYWHL